MERERFNKLIDTHFDELARELDLDRIRFKARYDTLKLGTFRSARITTNIHVDGIGFVSVEGDIRHTTTEGDV